MSNRFFTFLSRFVAGTKARADAANSRFDEVEDGFAAAAAELDAINLSINTPMAPANLASAATTAISTADSNNVTLTGVAAITAFDAMAAGTVRRVTANGTFVLTHHATALILPGGANIQAAAGDTFTMMSLGSGNWRVLDYTYAAGMAKRNGDSTQDFNAKTITAYSSIISSGSISVGTVLNEKKGSDIASAATIDLDAATGNFVDVTGTTTITAVTLGEGSSRTVRFTGALQITHSASLVLPGAANITTNAGTTFAIFRGDAGGVVRCVYCSEAAAQQGRLIDIQAYTNTAGGTWTKPANVSSAGFCIIKLLGGGGGGGCVTGAASQAAVATGGTSGAYAEFKVAIGNMGASETWDVGAGATGKSTAGAGVDGGNTTFTVNGGAGMLTARGGRGGNVLTAGTVFVNAPTAIPFNPGYTIDGTSTGVTLLKEFRGDMGSTAIRWSGSQAISGSGGVSPLGGTPGYAVINESGNAATGNTGCGGSGGCMINATNTASGGAGANGLIIIETYA